VDTKIHGVQAVGIKKTEIAQLDQQHRYRDLTFETAKWVSAILQELKGQIDRWLGPPWRVLNVRSWTTGKGASMGPNSWHTDGDDPDILKLMIYSTPTGGNYGGLELETKSLNGESWVVFYNSRVRHRAIAPRIEGVQRVATEVTLKPAREHDLVPRFIGHMARA
jgi:hypothetical protein